MTEKIYLENPYIRQLSAMVVNSEKKGPNYHIILNRTIFIPRTEEEIIDKGTIDGIDVIDVFEEGKDIVHVLEYDLTGEVIIDLDWNTRFDYMQQYTGGEILKASLEKLCESSSVDVSVKKDYSTISVSGLSLTHMDIERVEKFANHIVYSNFKIEEDNRCAKQVISIDNIYTGESRYIHCSSTGEVGIVKILDSVRKGDKVVIEFVSGTRALKDYEKKNKIIKSLRDILSVSENSLLDEVESILSVFK